MWLHATRDGLTPAYYRSMLDDDSEVPLPKEVERLTKIEVTEDGIVDYVDLEPEEGLTEEEAGHQGARMEAITEETKACIQKSLRIAEVCQAIGVRLDVRDIRINRPPSSSSFSLMRG